MERAVEKSMEASLGKRPDAQGGIDDDDNGPQPLASEAPQSAPPSFAPLPSADVSDRPSVASPGLYSPASGASQAGMDIGMDIEVDTVDVNLFAAVASRRSAVDRGDVARHVGRGGVRVGGNGMDREARLPSGGGGPIGEVFSSESRSETPACAKAATPVESFAPPAIDHERGHAPCVAAPATAQALRYPHGGGFCVPSRVPVDDIDRSSELELRDIC